jgi:hypothetical protein
LIALNHVEMTANNPLKTAALASLLALMPMAADATVMRAVSFDEKVENSAAIVAGRCVRAESRWDASGKTIYTYTTFSVDKVIKGAAQPTREITVVTPGGTVGHIRQDSIGVPSFQEGDENVLFVRNSAIGPTIAYLEQGAYELVRDGNEQVVRPVATEAVHIDEQRGVAVPAESARPLRVFEGEVRAAERRIAFQRNELIERQRREAAAQSSIWSTIKRNRLLVALAIIGAALATWTLVRR